MRPAPSEFRWEQWNVDLATKHGCTIKEIERVVRFPPSGFPRTSPRRNGPSQAWIIEGRGQGGRPIDVVFLMDDDDTAVVIHAQHLAPRGRRGRR